MRRTFSGLPLLTLLAFACGAPSHTPAAGRPSDSTSRVAAIDTGANAGDPRSRIAAADPSSDGGSAPAAPSGQTPFGGGSQAALARVRAAEQARPQIESSDAAADAPQAGLTPEQLLRVRQAIRDQRSVFGTPLTARPTYLRRAFDPVFGTAVMRIAGETGSPIGAVPGTWGADARHVYSKQEPWSADGSLIMVQNRGGGGPPQVVLDGQTFEPRFAPCHPSPLWDYRWHPAAAHAHEMINVDKGGSRLDWFDVTSCAITRQWTLPFPVDGFGSGEGNPSNDGRFVALGSQKAMFVVDMDPQSPAAPYPNYRIGPIYSFPPCSLNVADPAMGKVDNISISASGRYVVVKYGGTGVDSTRDAIRIYDVDPATLALSPRAMSASAMRCGSFAARPNGWITPLKHPDIGLDPFDGNEDVVVGGRSCPGSKIGHVIKVRMRDGQVTALTDPGNEAGLGHVSMRAVDRPGWAYVSYATEPGKRYSDEIVAVRLDGGDIQRIAHMHSVTPGCYRCEPHAVPSPDGRHVIFASNWSEDCAPDCGTPTDIKDYVVTVPGVETAQRMTTNRPSAAPPGERMRKK
jgi:hypothetical protein